MRIESSDTIAGVPILRIRELMRQMHARLWHFDLTDIAHILDIPSAQAEAVIQELVRRKMLVQGCDPRQVERTIYTQTEAGVRLATARANKPLKRTTADRLLSEFLARIEPINQDVYYLYQVSRVVLFGSYLSDAPTLGDIDLIVHLEPKERRHRRHKRLCEQRNREFQRRGWNVSWLDMYALYDTLPKREIFVTLRKRSSYLSLHSVRDEVVIENEPHQVIYGNADWVIPDEMRDMWGVPEAI